MIVIRAGTFRWELDKAGRNSSLVDLRSGAEHLPARGAPVARLIRDGEPVMPATLDRTGNRLDLTFADGSHVALDIRERSGYLILTVTAVEAEVFDKLEFLVVPLSGRPSAVPDTFSFCAVARNLQTRVDELPGPQIRLYAACYPKFGTVGASVAMIGEPFRELRNRLKEVVTDATALPKSPLGGPWALDAPENRNSYLFGVATEETVDEWIALCHDFGIGQLHFCGGGAFRIGDYTPSPDLYPDGVDSVRRVVDKLHAAGLQAGLHTMSFSIAKNSPYVTPIPDPRLGADNIFTLARDLTSDAASVEVVEPTAHMPLRTSYHIRRSMTLLVDRELIDYTGVKADAPFALTGCTRGVCGTTPTPHRAGAAVRHLKACWGLFAPDGTSSLFTEVTANIANLINAAGFDMVYLDGLDGIHILGGEEGRWHYGGRFAFEVFERLDHPIIMEMAAFLHHLWFLRSRMGAWDHPTRGHRRFIDLHCRSNANFARIFLPAHLGWWAPRVSTGAKDETTHLEDVAYLCTKALADDIGFSLQGLSPGIVRDTPHLARTAAVFRRFEELRRSGVVSDRVRRQLARPGAEFALTQTTEGPEFRPVHRCSRVFGTAGLDNVTWHVQNPFTGQAPSGRIEALWSVAEYDSPEGLTLAEFTDPHEFDDSDPVHVLLNSGKDYMYPAVAPGMSVRLAPLRDGGPGGLPGIEFLAVRTATEEKIPSSAADDDLSMLDHGERIYRTRTASWGRVGKRFAPELDLGERKAMGCWVRGDGSAAVLNFQLRSAGRFFSLADHYVILDFEDWRYCELVEPESECFDRFSWPYGRAVYKLHRHGVEYDAVCALHLWLNNVPVGLSARACLSPVRALPPVSNTLRRPRLIVNGQAVTFPVELASGSRLEWNAESCTVYGSKGGVIERAILDASALNLVSGENHVEFACDGTAPRPRARVTLAVQGKAL